MDPSDCGLDMIAITPKKAKATTQRNNMKCVPTHPKPMGNGYPKYVNVTTSPRRNALMNSVYKWPKYFSLMEK